MDFALTHKLKPRYDESHEGSSPAQQVIPQTPLLSKFQICDICVLELVKDVAAKEADQHRRKIIKVMEERGREEVKFSQCVACGFSIVSRLASFKSQFSVY